MTNRMAPTLMYMGYPFLSRTGTVGALTVPHAPVAAFHRLCIGFFAAP